MLTLDKVLQISVREHKAYLIRGVDIPKEVWKISDNYWNIGNASPTQTLAEFARDRTRCGAVPEDDPDPVTGWVGSCYFDVTNRARIALLPAFLLDPYLMPVSNEWGEVCP